MPHIKLIHASHGFAVSGWIFWGGDQGWSRSQSRARPLATILNRLRGSQSEPRASAEKIDLLCGMERAVGAEPVYTPFCEFANKTIQFGPSFTVYFPIHKKCAGDEVCRANGG